MEEAEEEVDAEGVREKVGSEPMGHPESDVKHDTEAACERGDEELASEPSGGQPADRGHEHEGVEEEGALADGAMRKEIEGEHEGAGGDEEGGPPGEFDGGVAAFGEEGEEGEEEGEAAEDSDHAPGVDAGGVTAGGEEFEAPAPGDEDGSDGAEG